MKDCARTEESTSKMDSVVKKKLRVFIGIGEICGYYTGLAEGLRLVGYSCTLVGATLDSREYILNEQTRLARIWISLLKARSRKDNPLVDLCRFLSERIVRWFFFVTMIATHDVFIFGYGRTFISSKLDLWVLNKLGKRTIVNIAHGSEARPPYLDGTRLNKDGSPRSALHYAVISRNLFRSVSRIEEFADVVIGYPFTCHFLRRRFVNLGMLGLIGPNSIGSGLSRHASDGRSTLRILHAPSDTVCKGTNEIRLAIEDLKLEGLDFEYVEIIGKTNALVQQELRNCDLVVDQLYSDTPMAGLAMEAAFHGVPSVVGGYCLNDLEPIYGKKLIPPSKTCKPEFVKEAIREMICNKAERDRIGYRAKEYVRSQWSLLEVAKRYSSLIQGRIPREYYYDPFDNKYLDGGGLPRVTRDQIISSILKEIGKSAFCLEHNKRLEAFFVEIGEAATRNENSKSFDKPL